MRPEQTATSVNVWVELLLQDHLLAIADIDDDQTVPFRQWILDWAAAHGIAPPPDPGRIPAYITAGELRHSLRQGMSVV